MNTVHAINVDHLVLEIFCCFMIFLPLLLKAGPIQGKNWMAFQIRWVILDRIFTHYCIPINLS